MTTRPNLTPRTIAEYLDQLRVALRGADPALIQDALYDAEEHLRAELADEPNRSEAAMLEKVANTYGAPEEVAELYRDQEIKVQRALRPPVQVKHRSAWGKFFGVAADSRTYGALFYMLLALATGIFYFTFTVVGISLSVSLSILIIGIPFILIFFGAIRMLALVEGRTVEALLGVRMPRRPAFPTRGMSFWKRMGAMFTDPRTWSTLFYMLMMLPLGIIYFTVTVTFSSVSLAFIGAPFFKLFASQLYIGDNTCDGPARLCEWVDWLNSWPGAFFLMVLGVVFLFATLHLIRGMGYLHGQLAKHLLVASPVAE